MPPRPDQTPLLTPSPLGRACPAAGAVISRGGTGEGLLPKDPNTRSVLRAISRGITLHRDGSRLALRCSVRSISLGSAPCDDIVDRAPHHVSEVGVNKGWCEEIEGAGLNSLHV